MHRSTYRPLRLCSLAFAAMLSAHAGAQSTAAPGAAGTTSGSSGAAAARAPAAAKPSSADRGFMRDAAHAGMLEVEASKLALQKATDPKIKQFAQQMVDEHTKAHDELALLASTRQFALPHEPSLVQKGKLKLLSAADGERFDRRYAESIGVQAHEDAVALFRKAATGDVDPDLKAFAVKTLPTLEKHLAMGRALVPTAAQK